MGNLNFSHPCRAWKSWVRCWNKHWRGSQCSGTVSKTPGDDGFTKELYEALFDLIGVALWDSLDAGFESGTLSISQNWGVFSLILKDDKNLTTLSN